MASRDETRAFLLESLRSRIKNSSELCSIAQGQIRAGEPDSALKNVVAVRRVMAEVVQLANSPYSASALRQTSQLLAELESQLARLEAAAVLFGGTMPEGKPFVAGRHLRDWH